MTMKKVKIMRSLCLRIRFDHIQTCCIIEKMITHRNKETFENIVKCSEVKS